MSELMPRGESHVVMASGGAGRRSRREVAAVNAVQRKTMVRMAEVLGESLVLCTKIREVGTDVSIAMTTDAQLSTLASCLTANDPIRLDEIRCYQTIARVINVDLLSDMGQQFRRI
jgi:hypothetical protein